MEASERDEAMGSGSRSGQLGDTDHGYLPRVSEAHPGPQRVCPVENKRGNGGFPWAPGGPDNRLPPTNFTS